MSALQQKLQLKTDEQLQYYLHHVDKHTEEAVLTALTILQQRNAELPLGIDEKVREQLALKRNMKKTGLDAYLVDDVAAPAFYSQKVIYIFSILFGVFLGACLLAYNLNKVGKTFWLVLGFGLIYWLVLGWALNEWGGGITAIFVGNSLGVVVLYEFFWNRIIGEKTEYSSKPFWIPLIVGLVFYVPLIWYLIEK